MPKKSFLTPIKTKNKTSSFLTPSTPEDSSSPDFAELPRERFISGKRDMPLNVFMKSDYKHTPTSPEGKGKTLFSSTKSPLLQTPSSVGTPNPDKKPQLQKQISGLKNGYVEPMKLKSPSPVIIRKPLPKVYSP